MTEPLPPDACQTMTHVREGVDRIDARPSHRSANNVYADRVSSVMKQQVLNSGRALVQPGNLTPLGQDEAIIEILC